APTAAESSPRNFAVDSCNENLREDRINRNCVVSAVSMPAPFRASARADRVVPCTRAQPRSARALGLLPRPVSEANGERVGVRGPLKRDGQFVAPLTQTRWRIESCALSPLSRGEGTIGERLPPSTRGHASLCPPYATFGGPGSAVHR